MTKVLVTGGAGFIGSHVVEAALERGYEVTVIDDLSQGRREWVDTRAKFMQGSVLDLDLMRDFSAGMDGIFHLAAMSRVLPSIGKGPASALGSAEANITGTLNALVAAAEGGVKKFVYSASSTFYGRSPAPQYEGDPVAAHTPYGVSKYVGELYCQQFSAMFNLPTVCLRYFQVYGPRCPSRGEYAMVSSIFIEQALRGEPLTINGDGKQRRDFVHVDDVAEANLRAFEAHACKDGVVLNVGTGKSYSVQELANLISDKQIYTAPRAFDMPETLADTSKCSRYLGWCPQIQFYDGTRRLMEHMGYNGTSRG